MGGVCSTHRRNEKCIKYFSWKISREEPLRRSRRRWVDNIRTDLREIVWKGVG